jgi:hypothetical protein
MSKKKAKQTQLSRGPQTPHPKGRPSGAHPTNPQNEEDERRHGHFVIGLDRLLRALDGIEAIQDKVPKELVERAREAFVMFVSSNRPADAADECVSCIGESSRDPIAFCGRPCTDLLTLVSMRRHEGAEPTTLDTLRLIQELTPEDTPPEDAAVTH